MAKDVCLHLYIDQLCREQFDSAVIVLFTKVVLCDCSRAFKLETQLLRDDFSVLTVEQLLLLFSIVKHSTLSALSEK